MAAKSPTNDDLAKGYESHGKAIEGLKSDVQRVDKFMVGITIVLFIAFITAIFTLVGVVVDGWRSKEGSFTELAVKVTEQGGKIDLLRQEIEKGSNAKRK